MAAAAVVAAAGGHFTPRTPAECSAPRMRRHSRAPPALPPGGRYGSFKSASSSFSSMKPFPSWIVWEGHQQQEGHKPCNSPLDMGMPRLSLSTARDCPSLSPVRKERGNGSIFPLPCAGLLLLSSQRRPSPTQECPKGADMSLLEEIFQLFAFNVTISCGKKKNAVRLPQCQSTGGEGQMVPGDTALVPSAPGHGSKATVAARKCQPMLILSVTHTGDAQICQVTCSPGFVPCSHLWGTGDFVNLGLSCIFCI